MHVLLNSHVQLVHATDSNQDLQVRKYWVPRNEVLVCLDQEIPCNEIAGAFNREKFQLRRARSIHFPLNSHVQHARSCMLAIRTFNYAKTGFRATNN